MQNEPYIEYCECCRLCREVVVSSVEVPDSFRFGRWSGTETKHAQVYAIKIMDAVVADNSALLLELCRELWGNLAWDSAVMSMLPRPVKTYLGREIMTYENGFRADNYDMG